MRPQERMYLPDRQWNPLLGLFPRKDTHFRLWREHRSLHSDSVRMRRDIVRQYEYGRLAAAHEIACNGEDEIGIVAIHLRQKMVHHLHRDLGPSLDQFRTPARNIVLIKEIAIPRARTAGLREHRRDHSIWRAL